MSSTEIGDWLDMTIRVGRAEALSSPLHLRQPRQLPRLAMDEKPRRKASDAVIDQMAECQRLLDRYRHGEFPPRINKEIERRVGELVDDVNEMIETGQTGQSNPERRLEDLKLLRRLGFWPGGWTDDEWAKKLFIGLRTYQRYKARLLAE